jgi:hypothetical protein
MIASSSSKIRTSKLIKVAGMDQQVMSTMLLVKFAALDLQHTLTASNKKKH